MPPNGPPPRPGHIPDHPTSPPPPMKQNGAMRDNIEQLKSALRDILAEQDQLRQRLATMREQLAALQALSRDLQADAPPYATPWQQADGWEGKR